MRVFFLVWVLNGDVFHGTQYFLTLEDCGRASSRLMDEKREEDKGLAFCESMLVIDVPFTRIKRPQ